MIKYFFSLQYSAIQKTILRHDRLWSMAGISSSLSELNEILLPQITKNNKGTVLVAGGGKYTACFDNEVDAWKSREEIIKKVATTFPMLEFQVSSEIIPAETLSAAKVEKILSENSVRSFPGLVNELNEQKKAFRGYGVIFNPHIKRCEECNEYPVTDVIVISSKEKKLCSICSSAIEKAKIVFKDITGQFHNEQSPVNGSQHTTIQKIYSEYYRLLAKEDSKLYYDLQNMQVPHNFEDLFSVKTPVKRDQDQWMGENQPQNDQDKKRMAVWFSDINNMNGKVPIWLSKKDEEIFGIFDQVKSVYIDITAQALANTFCDISGEYIPFRIIVAGGDDLCLVMDEKYILDFTVNLSNALHETRKKIASTTESENSSKSENYLSIEWLNKNKLPPREGEEAKKIKPYGFGASFIISDIHTPFEKIHEIGEKLMSKAKQESERWDNSINWSIMAEDNPLSNRIFKFEKPLYIEEIDQIEFTDNADKQHFTWNKLSFKKYMELCGKYSGISSSHLYQIVKKIELNNDASALERWFILLDSEEGDKSFSGILREPCFRSGLGELIIERIMTLFELLSIKRNIKNDPK